MRTFSFWLTIDVMSPRQGGAYGESLKSSWAVDIHDLLELMLVRDLETLDP